MTNSIPMTQETARDVIFEGVYTNPTLVRGEYMSPITKILGDRIYQGGVAIDEDREISICREFKNSSSIYVMMNVTYPSETTAGYIQPNMITKLELLVWGNKLYIISNLHAKFFKLLSEDDKRYIVDFWMEKINEKYKLFKIKKSRR